MQFRSQNRQAQQERARTFIMRLGRFSAVRTASRAATVGEVLRIYDAQRPSRLAAMVLP
jgi:hypothetical protein